MVGGTFPAKNCTRGNRIWSFRILDTNKHEDARRVKEITCVQIGFILTCKRSEKERCLFISLVEPAFEGNARHVHGNSSSGKHVFLNKRQATVKTASVLASMGSYGCLYIATRIGMFNKLCFFIGAFLGFFFAQLSHLISEKMAFYRDKAVVEHAAATDIELLFMPAYSIQFSRVKSVFSVVERHHFAQRSMDWSSESVTPLFDMSTSVVINP